jgi:salicylate hydroxylase
MNSLPPALPRSTPRLFKKTVVIAGAGIGGLAAALALARYGIASKVLERRPVFGEDSAGIQIGPNGTRILEALGAAEFLRPKVAVPDFLRVIDAASGHRIATLPLGRWIADRHGAPYWAAHRRDLHGALLKAAERQPLVTIRYATHVTLVEEDRRSVKVFSAAAEEIAGDAFVAADGMWSLLRTSAFAGATPRYTGKCAVRTVIPVDDLPDGLSRSDVQLWVGRNVHVVHYPVNAGRAVALVAIFSDRRIAGEWSAPCDSAWVAEQAAAAGLAPLLRELLAKPADWRRWSLMKLPRATRIAQGRMALLGDAAHPMLPFLAQGGAMALEDAAVLADVLAADTAEPADALRRYAARRGARVRRVARASALNGHVYHLDGMMAAARDRVLAGLSPETLMRRYDWLYGWRQFAA